MQEDNLEIPHPRLQDRVFVLIPFNEIEPQFRHPRSQKTVSNLLSELQNQKSVHLYKKHWL